MDDFMWAIYTTSVGLAVTVDGKTDRNVKNREVSIFMQKGKTNSSLQNINNDL